MTPEGDEQGSLPLLNRFSLGIGLLFRGALVLLPRPVIGLELFTMVVHTLTSTIVIPRTPEITLIAHLKGIDQKNTELVKLALQALKLLKCLEAENYCNMAQSNRSFYLQAYKYFFSGVWQRKTLPYKMYHRCMEDNTANNIFTDKFIITLKVTFEICELPKCSTTTIGNN